MIRLCELNKDPAKYAGEVEIAGWVRTVRDSKNIGFIELSDGSCFRNVQVVYENNIPNDIIKQINTGCAISVVGDLVLTPDAKQPFEVKAREIKIEGLCASDYPMQKKRHSLEYLRTMQHLRPRTNTFQATFRVRNVVAQAIHRFFDERGFLYVHTPLITASDCEGAGEMFRVTTLDPDNPPLNRRRYRWTTPRISSAKPTNLTVSGQLEAESFGHGLRQCLYLRPHLPRRDSPTPPAMRLSSG